MARKVQTLIIGGGQAGLALSYFLSDLGHDHVILERAAQPAYAWREQRWDSFALNTPNWAMRLPGMEYNGPEPDKFMPRAEIVAYFERYIKAFDLPVSFGTPVSLVESEPAGRGYRVTAGADVAQLYQADNVVVATGLFQKPRIPAYSSEIPAGVLQIHSSQYRNPQTLPPGAVLIVGSGQSGCQIAEELYQSGRKIYLCVGTAGRFPRRYRGQDIFEWMKLVGFLDRTLDQLPSPQAKFAGNPQVSGTDGGHSLNLHQFVRDGVTLLGRITGARSGRVGLAPDLHETLARIDKFEADMITTIDDFILKNGLAAPLEELPQLSDGFDCEESTQLDLKSAGIGTIIWSAGYSFDFGLVNLPVVDEVGYPLQQRGVTRFPGLYFLGMHWLYQFKSGLLVGVADDARSLASRITASSTGET